MVIQLYTNMENLQKIQSGEKTFEAWTKEGKSWGDIPINVPVDSILEIEEQPDKSKIFTIKNKLKPKNKTKSHEMTVEGNFIVKSSYEDSEFVLETEYKGYPVKLTIELDKIQTNLDEAMRIVFAKAFQLAETIEKISKTDKTS